MGTLGAPGRDGGFADKAGGFVDRETRRVHVSLQVGTRFQGATLACQDVAFNRSLNGDETRFDVTYNFAASANGQRPSGCDRPIDFAFDDQLTTAGHIAFD